MLRILFPRSDPTRIMRPAPVSGAPTPIKDMYTFSKYPQTSACFCNDKDYCNEMHSSSATRTASMGILALILMQFISCQLF